MDDNIPFACRNCGASTFRTARKPESLSDLDGAVCAECGTPFSQEDVKEQARRIAERKIKEAFKRR
jgi:DNA-directed RNA polymerase subunit RPC12/RpoP